MQAFPGQGQMKPDDAELDRLRKEIVKLDAERDLLAWGIDCGLHRVERLMRSAGLKARKARRRKPYDAVQRHTIAPNLLERQFAAPGPNLKWAADFTYLWTHEGWLYVAVAIDPFSCRVAGWSSNPRMTAQLVMDALMTSVWRRGSPRAVLHHSDQGWSSQDLMDTTLGLSMS